DGVVGQLGRRILGAHALAALFPARAAVLREPDAAGRDRDPYAPRIARIDTDRMNAGQLGAAAHPLLALGMIPQRADHFPALAVIWRAEQPAWQRAAPDDARLVGAAGRERPDARRRPLDGTAPHVF